MYKDIRNPVLESIPFSSTILRKWPERWKSNQKPIGGPILWKVLLEGKKFSSKSKNLLLKAVFLKVYSMKGVRPPDSLKFMPRKEMPRFFKEWAFEKRKINFIQKGRFLTVCRLCDFQKGNFSILNLGNAFLSKNTGEIQWFTPYVDT